MIIELLLGLVGGVMDWGISLLPTDDPPEWLTTVGGFISGQLDAVSGLGAWIPWTFAILIFGTLFTLWAAFLLVKFVRWVLNWIPTWGGS